MLSPRTKLAQIVHFGKFSHILSSSTAKVSRDDFQTKPDHELVFELSAVSHISAIEIKKNPIQYLKIT